MNHHEMIRFIPIIKPIQDNCYCYVCDTPAKDCKKWDGHCQACHGERRWREERERFKRLGVEAASATAQPAAAAAAPTVSTATMAPRMAISTSSFMNNRPTGFIMRTVIPPNSHFSNRPNLPRYSVSALLEQLTIVHPVEATPPENRFSTNLRHYQKQRCVRVTLNFCICMCLALRT